MEKRRECVLKKFYLEKRQSFASSSLLSNEIHYYSFHPTLSFRSQEESVWWMRWEWECVECE